MKSAAYISKLFKGFVIVDADVRQSGNYVHYTFKPVHDARPWKDPLTTVVAQCTYEIFIPLVEVTGRRECHREWRQAKELVKALCGLPHISKKGGNDADEEAPDHGNA